MTTAFTRGAQITNEQAAARVAFADAALGAAGHEITDPRLNAIRVAAARGELSGDEARELSRKHILGR